MSPLLLYVCMTVFLIKGLCACSALFFLRFFHTCGDYKFRVYTPGNSSWASWTPTPPPILEHTHSSPPPIFYSEAVAGGKANRQSSNSAVVRHGRAAVWAYLLAGKLHLTSPCSSSPPLSHSVLPCLPPSLLLPSPLVVLQLQSLCSYYQAEGAHTHIHIDCWFSPLPEHVPRCWGPSGMLDSAFVFFFPLTYSLC